MVNLDHQLLASFNVPYRLVNPGNLTPNLNRGVVEVGAGLSDKAKPGEAGREDKKTEEDAARTRRSDEGKNQPSK